MKLARLTWLAFFIFATSVVTSLVGAVHSHGRFSPAVHMERACPDSGPEGRPCGPACTCTCCPGHVLKVFFSQTIALMPPSSERFGWVSGGDLQSKDLHFRIFRPPRA